MNTQFQSPQFGRRGRAPALTLEYVPQPGLGALSLKNFLLNVVTLGIYSFWGKTNVRRHIWSCVRFMGEPLEYTGTGRELFLGMLIVVALVVLPLSILPITIQLMFPPDHPAAIAAQIIPAIIVLFLIGIGIYRARRYRLSRTLWRGIRGTLTGSPLRYAWRNFWMLLLLPFTLMWSYPWMRMRLNSLMVNDMEFGSAAFDFTGPTGPLYKRFAILWIGSVVGLVLISLLLWQSQGAGNAADPGEVFAGLNPETMGIVIVALAVIVIPAFFLMISIFRAVYLAGELNHFARCTGFEGLRFGMNATTFSLVGLAIGNLLILVLSLGIAAPFVQQRLIRYLCDRLTISGTLDVVSIQQSRAEVDKRGEGLAEVFDIDAF